MSAAATEGVRVELFRARPAEASSRPLRRPLFLGTRLRARVDADGPSLRLRAEGRAETRFPLERVSRIVAGARVTWSAEALRACFEGAIPIVVMREDGSTLGSIHPARVQRARLAEALEELLDWPDWHDVYHCWLRSARMRVLTDWRRAQASQKATGDLHIYQDFVKRQVYRVGSAPALQRPGFFWQSILYSTAAEMLSRWGVPAVLWGSGGDPLDLRRDLAELLELRLRLEVRQEAEGALKSEKSMLLVANALTGKLELEAARAMRSLARRVSQVLSEWR